MEESIINTLKQRPIIISRLLFNNYKKLNINEEELIILIYIMDKGDKIIYNPEIFVEELGFDKFRAMEIINNLMEKKIINITVEQNKNKKSEEYINIDTLYNKLFNITIDKNEDTIDTTSIFSKFENEFGRPISPMEYEIIKGWINDKFNEEIITEALKEAVYNNVNNLRYIDKILYEWKKKGYKNNEVVIKSKINNHKNKKENIEVFDYNWLEDE